MRGRLEDSNKRLREEADLSFNAASAGQGADVLQQLAGSRKRHRGPSWTERGGIPIAGLLNSPEASSDSEQSGSDQSPVPVERSLEHAGRGALRQSPLGDPLRSPGQFGIPHRDPGSARRGADIASPTTDNPLEKSTVGIQHRKFKNKQKKIRTVTRADDPGNSLILTQYFKTEKGIDIGVESIRGGGLRRPETIVQHAKNSGNLSGLALKRGVSYWVRQARAWEEARKNRNTPDQSVINDPSRYPDQSIPSSAGITNPTTDNPPEESTVGIQDIKFKNKQKRRKMKIGTANHTKHSLVLTRYLQEVKGVTIDVKSSTQAADKWPETIVRNATSFRKIIWLYVCKLLGSEGTSMGSKQKRWRPL